MTRGMTPADLFRIQWVSDARIAPDGRTLAFTITCLDEGENHELSRSGKPSHRVQRLVTFRSSMKVAMPEVAEPSHAAYPS